MGCTIDYRIDYRTQIFHILSLLDEYNIDMATDGAVST